MTVGIRCSSLHGHVPISWLSTADLGWIIQVVILHHLGWRDQHPPQLGKTWPKQTKEQNATQIQPLKIKEARGTSNSSDILPSRSSRSHRNHRLHFTKLAHRKFTINSHKYPESTRQETENATPLSEEIMFCAKSHWRKSIRVSGQSEALSQKAMSSLVLSYRISTSLLRKMGSIQTHFAL